MTGSEDSHNKSDPSAHESSVTQDIPLTAPAGEDGSSLDDATPTRTYQGNVPNVLDQTVISDGPIVPAPNLLAGPPLQMRDIGKALAGQQLGHFQLEEFVGGGGMGAVFRATDTQLERTVAVKVLTQRYGGREETVRRFRVEAQSAARLNHENIATVFFVGEDKGWNFIVFEFIEGENVRDLVARAGPMEIGLALSCAAQVAEALQHAADREVVHRDIKPSNVLLAPDGRAKLVDMGLARLRQVESSDDDLTVSGVTLGTFDYISPEQGRDPRNADVRSDLYSLGCTLYYMLTGQPPFPDRTVLQKLLSHTSDPAPDPRVLRPETPDDVAEITLRLLEKRPEDRYSQPSFLIHDIVQAGERNDYALGVAAPVLPAAVVEAPGPLYRSLPWLVPTLALLAAVFAADSFLDRSGGSTTGLPSFVVPESNVNSANDADNGNTGLLIDDSAVGSMSWPPGSADPVADDGLASSEFPAAPLLRGVDSGNAGVTGQAEALPVESPLAGLVTEMTGSSTTEGSGPTEGTPASSAGDSMPVNSSVDIIVAQASELSALSDAEANYLVVTSLSEALDIVAMNPKLTHIQLRTNFSLVGSPLKITSERLRVSAAEGFTPVLRFAPNDAAVSDFNERVGMIDVLRGSVRFEGIHFELDTRSYSRSCSLFRVHRADLLALSDSWVRIIGDPAEIVSDERSLIAVAPSSESAERVSKFESAEASEELPVPPLELQWRNVVFGGEATVLSVREARPLRLAWTNGFVATSRAFAEIGGVATSPGEGDQIQLDLDQVTAVIDQGLCRSVATSELPNLLTVDLHATRSILVSPEQQALITSVGYTQSVEDLESHLLFNGERNFYEGAEVFWEKMQLPQPGVVMAMPTRVGFDDWQRRWQTEERRWYRNKVLWQTAADPNLPRHVTTPGDFMLSDAPNNPARRAGGGVERSDAGFQASQLPSLPADLR